MKRFADLFVALCIVAVAASATVVVRFQLGFGWETSAVVGIGLMLALFILQLQTSRLQDRDHLALEVARVVERLGGVVDHAENLERRLTGVESLLVQQTRRPGKEEIESVVAEVEVIGAMLRQVVETVADLEGRVYSGDVPVMPAPEAVSRPEPAPRPAAPPPPPPPELPLVPQRFAHLGEAGFLDLIRAAVEANRIDVYLQPIVTLPQRRIRFYEALTRLRTETGETIYPSDYIPLAEAGGLMGLVDSQILLRAVQILRRLSIRSRDVGLFCNLSTASLADAGYFREIYGLLEANKSLADSLVLELPQAAVRQIGPIEWEALRALQAIGYRFSVDNVTDLKPSFQLLAERGFRHAKIACERILTRSAELGTDIHPADIASYLARFGIELIVDRVESETQVVDVLDYGVRFGQGFVFSPPRPVRNDSLGAEPVAEPAASAPPVPPSAAPAPPPAAPQRPVLVEPRGREDRRGVVGRAIAGR